MTDQQQPALPPIPDEVDAVLDTIESLPPASEDQGNPGHDLFRASARRSQAVRLRASGATYEQIAQVAGYANKSAARQSVMRALRGVEMESVQELRTLENARLDEDEMVLRSLIRDASLPPARRIQAIDSRLRLAARRATLNGLDAPKQVVISAGVQAQLEDALADLHEVVLGEAWETTTPDDEAQ